MQVLFPKTWLTDIHVGLKSDWIGLGDSVQLVQQGPDSISVHITKNFNIFFHVFSKNVLLGYLTNEVAASLNFPLDRNAIAKGRIVAVERSYGDGVASLRIAISIWGERKDLIAPRKRHVIFSRPRINDDMGKK